MAKKKVFVSFDWDNDRKYKHLLEAWDENPNFDFVFKDETPGEIDTSDISRIKAGLTLKINDANYTLFIVGKYANAKHKNSNEIGFDNWINFEAHQSIESKNHLAVVKLDKENAVPRELISSGYWHITGFTEKNVINVLDNSSK